MHAALLGSVIFAAAMFGVLSRPLGILASLWPANAIFLGALVLRRASAHPVNWLAAAAAYLLAGQLAGDPIERALSLTAANLVSVGVGYGMIVLLGNRRRPLSHPLGVLHLLLITTVAAAAAAAFGSGRVPAFRNYSDTEMFALWFSSELSNYLIVLPALLTAGAYFTREGRTRILQGLVRAPASAGPVLAVALSSAVTILVGGPGAIAFSVPALLWCSLSYRLFPTAVITMLFSMVMIWAGAAGHLYPPGAFKLIDGTISFRLGLSLLALGPLTVASMTNAQRDLLTRLDHAASIDGLTNIFARRAFMEQGDMMIERCRMDDRPAALMMIDIDHFKAINDRHGHAAGDEALAAVASGIREALRAGDVLGRLGGEEFAVALAGVEAHEAAAIAQRCRRTVETLALRTSDGAALNVTISIGLVHVAQVPGHGLPALLRMADIGLYRAKERGRNQVCAYTGDRDVSRLPDHKDAICDHGTA